MENPEEKTEKQPENTETKPKSVKIDGISSQINLGQGTPAHQQWARIMVTSGHSSPSACLKMVMDAYESPARNADDQATIANLENEVNDLKGENSAYEATLQNKDLEIAELKKQLEEAKKMANDNAVNGLGKQAQIEDLQQQIEGAVIIRPNLAEKHFIDLMAERCGVPAERMLRRLFWDDLENPRSNNFKDRRGHEVRVPDSAEIRSTIEELKKQMQQ